VHGDLLDQATLLAGRDPTRPKQANLRRAVSSAYYAIFHYLVDQACRELLGTQNEKSGYRHELARAFDHGCMKEACVAFRDVSLPKRMTSALPATFGIPPELQFVAETFVQAQEKRHIADYDLSIRFTRWDVAGFILEVERAISTFETIASVNSRQFSLVCLLTWRTLKR
jgi:hypothetical protein